ncbi:FecR family protein [Pedobacter nyackensis]|uniref:FecR family protein n=1 Tax=Pedobacter nyackensis TaxID=475255 RepID=A0A1W2ES39_9SPHI|nr:FecR family protein [Pedobacter nyackensis]SMD12465.1 FecR family protein [Pedobacter nyackensis]
MKKEEFRNLVERITDGSASDVEIALYNRYYHQYQKAGASWSEADMGEETAIKEKLKQRIDQKIKPVVIVPLWRRYIKYAAAAVVLLTLSTTLYLYFNTSFLKSSADLVQQDIAPGGNKAVLTLADGRTINLSDAVNGNLAEQAGIAITKNEDGKLTYTAGKVNVNHPVSYNTIATPVGGQYQVNLPDGTKVWLNAASSLKFPTSFAKLKERKVELTGEAYFEVTHSRDLPFVVKSGKQELSVLGTHFNINSYPDEGAIRTTLLQGSVIVRNLEKVKNKQLGKDSVLLKPEQQASLKDVFSVKVVDVEGVTAWKDGNFLFNDTDLKDIMKQVSRWYNVSVDYDEIPKNRFFTGFISRNVNLSRVLEMLEVTGNIQFKIEDKTIKITDLKKEPM